jgi:hypothetical protein
LLIFGSLGFSEPMAARPRFHANDTTRDVLNVVPRTVVVDDARHRAQPPGLDVEGFTLRAHASAVHDFRDPAEIARVHVAEIRELLLVASGADHVEVTGSGVLRFAERSAESGARNNSRPARFVHVDVSDATAQAFYARSRPANGREIRRSAQYNVWRVLTPPPQDVPLAVCDAASVAGDDLIAADAVFDTPGRPEWSFEGLVVAHNPAHRWHWFPDMNREEALVFKTHDSDREQAHCVPHVAFDNPLVGADAAPRASIEMRATALWFA